MNISKSTQKARNKKSNVFNSVSYNRIEDNLSAEQENRYSENVSAPAVAPAAPPVAPPPVVPPPVAPPAAPAVEAPIRQRPTAPQQVAPPPVAPPAAPAVEAPVRQRPVAPPPTAPVTEVEAPIVTEPVIEEPVASEPVVPEPIVREPTIEEHTTPGSAVEQPVRRAPVRREPVRGELTRRETPPEKPNSNVKKEPKTISPKVRLELYDWIQCIVTAILCCVLIFIFVGRQIGVEGNSMMQTLKYNDRVVISNFFYTPENGDIVVFKSISEQIGHPLVKRIIGTAGQTVDIDFEAGNVYVDGVMLHEPYTNTPTNAMSDFSGPVIIPPGYVFVLGDNRNSSRDSRDSDIGLVDTRYILGEVLFILMPGRDLDGQRDWSRFGVVR